MSAMRSRSNMRERVAAQRALERISLGSDEETGDEAAVRPQVAAGHHVLEHGAVREQSHALERARHAGADELARSQVRLAGAGIVHVSLRGLHETARDVEGGGLAGAVRSDESDDLARGHVEGDVVERAQAFEVDRDMFEFEQ